MTITSKIAEYTQMALIIVILILVAAGILVVYFRKKRKAWSPKAKMIDYSTFERRDSTEYVKFDDIIEDVSGGILVMDNYTRFMAGIYTMGFNYSSASKYEKGTAMIGMLELVCKITNQIQYHQCNRSVDLSETIDSYKKLEQELGEKGYLLEQEYKELTEIMEMAPDEEKEYFIEKLEKMQKELKYYEKRMKYNRGLTNYGVAISGELSKPDREQMYLYDWIYDENIFSQPLNKEERRKRAISELNNIGRSYMESLNAANVHAERMDASELLENIHYHNKPNTAEDGRITDLFGNEYEKMVVTTDSYTQMRQSMDDEAEEKKVMEAYREFKEGKMERKSMEELYKQLVDIEKRLDGEAHE